MPIKYFKLNLFCEFSRSCMINEGYTDAFKLTLSTPGFHKPVQAGGSETAPPSKLCSLLSELNQILYRKIQSYEKSLCKISNVLVKK